MSSQQDKVSYDQAFQWISVVREMIEHENGLINQRMTWMWTLQGLLLTAIGLVGKANPFLVTVIAIVGLIFSTSIGYSLERGTRTIRDLLHIAREYKENLSPVIELPPTIGARSKGQQWLMPNRCLPWVFTVVWISILAFE